MITIHVFLNNGYELQMPCPMLMTATDCHTLARQISEAPMTYCTRIGRISYRNGKEENV